MHSAVRAVPATITDLVVDLASTPLSELLSGDLAGSVCGEVADALGVAGAACLLCDSDRVVVAGWSDPRAWSLACLQAEQRDGPALRAVTEGRTVVEADLHRLARDPHTARALVLRVGATVATPLRCSDRVLGSLQLYLDADRSPTADLVAGAEALARVLGTVTANTDLYRRSAETAAHLTEVLTSRAPVEQAKGALAERYRIGVAEAFGLLRAQARNRRQTVTAVARDVLAHVPGGPRPVPSDALSHSSQGGEAGGTSPGVAPAPPLRVPADHHRPVRVSRRPLAREAQTTPSDAQRPLRDASSRPQDRRSTDPASA
ncbi:ANTAR domain-containing protein [Geodermatophilus obscurus]|uniref:ANTAR domain-containing protein n=1 Tax=Geodermatophilus obscurus TaxID=1861 RepID=A0A1I5GB38_9ACTN|nr:GAF and ANTAR domain-containing protein [Geodermatophilus obscurus]SFO33137.1 ANTAR domain-containing protein [Geodermatophilus obscurus]